MFAGNFAPRSWALCDGQLLPISQNTALFSLYGTTYGGDGRTTFALPDLRGRIPIHAGNGAGQGSRGGAEQVTLSVAEIPSHAHSISTASSKEANTSNPVGSVYARTTVDGAYSSTNLATTAGTTSSTGGSVAHNNMPPTLFVTFIVALTGIFPSRS